MKRTGYIYDKICDIENIKKAIMKSSLGKRDHTAVKRVMGNIDYYAEEVRNMLVNCSYIPSPYVTRTIQDGNCKKSRIIHKPKYYPDQIIHWALMLQIEPIIMRGMYVYSCGSIPGRGTSYGQKIVRKWLDKDVKNTKYCLKLDVRKFYPSINNETLKSMLQAKIKDEKCLWLIDTIVDSADGLPIGNFTSQWFSNFYLQGLDHYIKQQLKAKYYIRYVDDMVIFGANKRKLHKTRVAVDEYLATIELGLKDNWQVFRIDKRDLDFLGLRFYRDRTTLRRSNSLRMARRARKIKKKGRLGYRDACAIVSYWGWVKRSDSYAFYHDKIKPYVDIASAKQVIRRYSQRVRLVR